MGEQSVGLSGRNAARLIAVRPLFSAVLAVAFGAILNSSDPAFAAPPKVVKATPDNGDTDVDPTLREYRIEFDQDMDQTGWSLCGTGPEVTGKPRWLTKRVLVVVVKLEPDRSYGFSINCPVGMNCKSASGESAEIYPIRFTTASAGGASAKRLSKTVNTKSFNELRRLIDEDYSYRDLRKVDWGEAFKKQKSELTAARTPAEFARTAAKLLAPAKDVHLSLQAGTVPMATFQRRYSPNFNFKLLEMIIPHWRKRSDVVFTGRFDDGPGYILITTWGPAHPADVEVAYSALRELADAKGIIIDVRPNPGGDESLARDFAGCFVAKSAVYSKNSSRDKEAKSGFGKVYKRSVKPNKAHPSYRGKVAVLMGEGCLSSCESFLLMMRHGAKAKLIGATSGGSSGRPLPHKLANGVFVFIPSWKDMQPDGTVIEGHGVEPDIAIKLNKGDLKASDPVLDAALKYLRKSEK